MRRALMILMLTLGLLAPMQATASPLVEGGLALEGEYEKFDERIGWGQGMALVSLGSTAVLRDDKGKLRPAVVILCLPTLTASALVTAKAYDEAPPGVAGRFRSDVFPVSALLSLAFNVTFAERGVFADDVETNAEFVPDKAKTWIEQANPEAVKATEAR